MGELNVLTPLRVESLAFGGTCAVIGAGKSRAQRAGAKLAAHLSEKTAVALVGVGGALAQGLVPGDLVIASELRNAESASICAIPGATLLASEIRRTNKRIQVGPIVTTSHYVSANEREALAATGALAVDMESAWVMDYLPRNPLAVIRSISDTRTRSPLRGGLRALGSLSSLRDPLQRWARACGTHELLLASPRSFCAGVDRAIDIVERAIALYGSPVYVRRQIVHNVHVVRDLEQKGAVFVEEIDDIPPNATVILAAHGVPPEVRRQANARRDLTVIDATCPLVAKVHTEARRFAAQDYSVVLIGHAEHEEVVGTYGEAPEHIHIVKNQSDVERLELEEGRPVAYLTQTTLATDETNQVVEVLRRRFPTMVGPPAADICYATQNRQDAVRSIARRCDLMLVVGSVNSSNTARLVEVAEREGCRAELIEDASQLALSWLADARTIGLTAGASAPEALVQGVINTLLSLGPVRVSEERVTQETMHFALPARLR